MTTHHQNASPVAPVSDRPRGSDTLVQRPLGIRNGWPKANWRSRWLPILALALLTACGGGLSEAQFAKIENGMSEEQVKALIGDPTKIESGSAIGISGTSYTYQVGDARATVAFLNGKVIGKQYQKTN